MKSKIYSLKQLASIKYGKNQRKVESQNGSVPIYGTGGLMGYAVKALYDKPSVLIGRKGTIDKIRYVEHPFWTVDTLFYTEINTDLVLPRYFYYLIKQVNLLQLNEGTTVPSLRTETLNRLEFEVPDLKEQKRRLSLIVPIEDKIALNNGLNQNLEQQAQMLYYDFINNNSVSLSKIGDIVLSANTGADAIKKAPIVDQNTGVRCVRVGDMSNHRPYNEWGYTQVTPEVFTQYQLHKDDIVVTRTATLGLNTLISSDISAVYNNGLIRLVINKQLALPLIVYLQLQSKDFFNYISRISGETSVRPNMKINYLLSYAFLLPAIDEQKQLYQLLQPLYEAQQNNILENMQLNELRDILLPKLMSGELDVSTIDI